MNSSSQPAEQACGLQFKHNRFYSTNNKMTKLCVIFTFNVKKNPNHLNCTMDGSSHKAKTDSHTGTFDLPTLPISSSSSFAAFPPLLPFILSLWSAIATLLLWDTGDICCLAFPYRHMEGHEKGPQTFK